MVAQYSSLQIAEYSRGSWSVEKTRGKGGVVSDRSRLPDAECAQSCSSNFVPTGEIANDMQGDMDFAQREFQPQNSDARVRG